MAKKKYTADKDGWYSTLVWDGTYDQYGRKHRKQLRSKKIKRRSGKDSYCVPEAGGGKEDHY